MTEVTGPKNFSRTRKRASKIRKNKKRIFPESAKEIPTETEVAPDTQHAIASQMAVFETLFCHKMGTFWGILPILIALPLFPFSISEKKHEENLVISTVTGAV